jgi:hypothetical protein
MSKQTAVEWLLNKMITEIHTSSEWNIICKEAKEMGKEHIIDSFDTGRRKGDWIFDGEKYYEETYKKEEK